MTDDFAIKGTGWIYDLVFPDVTRFEVIDKNGRSYVNMEVTEAGLALQDDNKTLKIFLKQVLTSAFAYGTLN